MSKLCFLYGVKGEEGNFFFVEGNYFLPPTQKKKNSIGSNLHKVGNHILILFLRGGGGGFTPLLPLLRTCKRKLSYFSRSSFILFSSIQTVSQK